MRKFIVSVFILGTLSSCIVSTAAKVVKTAGKVAVGTVKATVKGVGWTVNKVNGKINEDRLDGRWKVVGQYRGNFDQFASQSDPVNEFRCDSGVEMYEFKMSREKMYHYKCGSNDPEKFKIKYSFEKNSETREYENMVTYGPSYFTIIDVTGDKLALEGFFVGENGSKEMSICLLEKVK